jgi:hypothetical protein
MFFESTLVSILILQIIGTIEFIVILINIQEEFYNKHLNHFKE